MNGQVVSVGIYHLCLYLSFFIGVFWLIGKKRI